MKTLINTILLIFRLNVAYAETPLSINDLVEPQAHAKSYLVVGISGLKTGRSTEDSENIFSNKIGPKSESSGVWSSLITVHSKIYKTVYLSHYSSDSEINSVLSLMEDKNKNCQIDRGLIMMINSWGAEISQKLARKYLKKCGTLPYLAILIEGVQKPTPFSFDKSLLAFNCVNYFQRHSTLKGTAIGNCKNYQMRYDNKEIDLFNAHIDTEWVGSRSGHMIIKNYLDESLPVMFTRDQYGIDFKEGLK